MFLLFSFSTDAPYWPHNADDYPLFNRLHPISRQARAGLQMGRLCRHSGGPVAVAARRQPVRHVTYTPGAHRLVPEVRPRLPVQRVRGGNSSFIKLREHIRGPRDTRQRLCRSAPHDAHGLSKPEPEFCRLADVHAETTGRVYYSFRPYFYGNFAP